MERAWLDCVATEARFGEGRRWALREECCRPHAESGRPGGLRGEATQTGRVARSGKQRTSESTSQQRRRIQTRRLRIPHRNGRRIASESRPVRRVPDHSAARRPRFCNGPSVVRLETIHRRATPTLLAKQTGKTARHGEEEHLSEWMEGRGLESARHSRHQRNDSKRECDQRRLCRCP